MIHTMKLSSLGDSKMRCRACNTLLTDAECVRKDQLTGEYLDMCTECLIAGNIGSMERYVQISEFTEDEDLVLINYGA